LQPCNTRPPPKFSPTLNPALPGKTLSARNRGHFAVTLLHRGRLIGVFRKKKKINSNTLKIKHMKTKIFSFITIAAIVLGIGTTAFAADKNVAAGSHEVSTVLTNVSKINKIEVRGNVELYVSDGDTDQVKVYNKYYEQSAMVQSQNGVLRISSYADKKLVVWVKSADLRSITAYDNAEVRSFGKLSPIDMTVTLNNNAYAKLDIAGYSVDITVNDRAKADLMGNVDVCSLKYDHSATVNSTEFAAEHITRSVDGIVSTGKAANDFAGL
jgi:hypothetical protein